MSFVYATPPSSGMSFGGGEVPSPLGSPRAIPGSPVYLPPVSEECELNKIYFIAKRVIGETPSVHSAEDLLKLVKLYPEDDLARLRADLEEMFSDDPDTTSWLLKQELLDSRPGKDHREREEPKTLCITAGGIGVRKKAVLESYTKTAGHGILVDSRDYVYSHMRNSYEKDCLVEIETEKVRAEKQKKAIEEDPKIASYQKARAIERVKPNKNLAISSTRKKWAKAARFISQLQLARAFNAGVPIDLRCSLSGDEEVINHIFETARAHKYTVTVLFTVADPETIASHICLKSEGLLSREYEEWKTVLPRLGSFVLKAKTVELYTVSRREEGGVSHDGRLVQRTRSVISEGLNIDRFRRTFMELCTHFGLSHRIFDEAVGRRG